MKIIVAGAGAGKTTSMAREVIARYRQLTDNKIIYVITYTNAAKDHIKNKLIEELGAIPKNIKVDTSHAFLLHELIFPFHRLLYDVHYSAVAVFKLPTDHYNKSRILKELHSQNIIHVDEVSKVAKYVAFGKTSDRAITKQIRKKIVGILQCYLDSIFIDEAQDMDEHLLKIVQTLDAVGFYIHLVGDPKQDLRGYKQFRELIKLNDKTVIYLSENHRCPDSHIMLANQYIPIKEQQQLSQEKDGSINIIFESSIDLDALLNNQHWDLKFIYQKQSQFQTNADSNDKPRDSLKYELKFVAEKSTVQQFTLEQKVYLLEKWILEKLDHFDNKKILAYMSQSLALKLSNKEIQRLSAAIDSNRLKKPIEGYFVDSIDKVKGLEGEKCLFILTSELAKYLLKMETKENKMMNYLYVALTRATQELTILITENVEMNYAEDVIEWQNRFLNPSIESTVRETII